MERLAPQLQVTDKYADELADTLLELVNINYVQSIETTESDGEMLLNEIRSNRKCLARYVSFPPPSKMNSKSSSSDEEEKKESVENLPCQKQVPTKLKSAMKGGTSPRNKTVSWAPDVYDPPPTSLSHSIKRGTRKQRLSKKHKRRGKDKKKKLISPTNLSISTTIMSYKPGDVGDTFGIMSEEKVESFGSSVSDNSCGSSFFSVFEQKAQYPVAEAL